jgi:hypothetical protein
MIVLGSRQLDQLFIVDRGSSTATFGFNNIINANPVSVIFEFGFLSEDVSVC